MPSPFFTKKKKIKRRHFGKVTKCYRILNF